MILILYSIVLFLFSIYSYALIDVNLTLLNNKYWERFRGVMVDFGYNQRELSSIVYVCLVLLLFGFFWYFVKNYKKYNPILIGLITGGILLFSYPFLSHDLFSYIFDAKIVTQYHQNPYFMRPQDFPSDQWLRFLHWTHRTYPYGPTFLIMTLIPSMIAGTKFILHFMLFKLMYVVLYFSSVWSLNRLNKKWAIIFAVHPLILIEGLMNSHNDLIGLSLGIIGIYGVLTKKNIIVSRLLLIYSAGIKFITAPIVLITKNKTLINRSLFIIFTGSMVYLSLTREIQPWYFLGFFAFIPFFEKEIMQFNIFLFALLLTNYLYIRYGVMNPELQSYWKNILLYVFFVINCAVIFWRVYLRKIPNRFEKSSLLIILVIISVITRFYMLTKTVQLALPAGRSIEPYTNIYIIPSLFVIAILLFIAIKNIPFLIKTTFLLLVIFSDFILFNTRQFSSTGLYTLLTIITVEVIIVSYSYFKKRQEWIDIQKLPTLFLSSILTLCLIIIIWSPIRYFSRDFGIMTVYYQKGIADSIAEYKTIWKRNQEINKKPVIYDDAINIRQFPDSFGQKATIYLLKKQFNLTVSQKGLPFIICYYDVCKKEYFMDGILKKGNLVLPSREKISFDQALLIFNVPGKIEVYGFR